MLVSSHCLNLRWFPESWISIRVVKFFRESLEVLAQLKTAVSHQIEEPNWPRGVTAKISGPEL